MTTLAPTPLPSSGGSDDGYLHLRALAEVYEDIQAVRIAVENRVRTAPIDADMIAPRLEGLASSEHQVALLLRRTFRKVVEPEIVGWQAETVGIGEHMLARLLGSIGHPVRTTVHGWEGTGSDRVLVVVGEKERRVSDFWSYCGHGDPARRAHKGMSAQEAAALGSPKAKMLVHLLAESCMKMKGGEDKNGNPLPLSPYRPVYDFARAKYQDRTHATPCVRCGPSGKPAAEGSPWSPAHQHAAALRLVGKEILRDLWSVAR